MGYSNVWASFEIEEARRKVCKHAVLSTLPNPGDPVCRGFEICPFCGVTAPMGTKFSETAFLDNLPRERETVVPGGNLRAEDLRLLFQYHDVCEHAVLETLPKPGDPQYKGFETCPYCGKTAPMFTKFSRTGKPEDIEH